MEILIYILLVVLSAVQLFVGIFVVDDHTLLPFTAVGLALAVLVLLIRIRYLEKKVKAVETQGPEINVSRQARTSLNEARHNGSSSS